MAAAACFFFFQDESRWPGLAEISALPRQEPAPIQAVAEAVSAKQNAPEKYGDREQRVGRIQNLNLLFSDKAEPPDLCRLPCERIGVLLREVKAYQRGSAPPAERGDTAYELTKLLFQRALGPPGKMMLEMMLLFEDPSGWRALALRPKDLIEVVAALDFVISQADEQEGPAEEADGIVRSLESASATCESREWPDTCRDLERKLAVW